MKQATCHPDRLVEAKGLCHACYTTLRLATSETQKLPCFKCKVRPRTKTTSYCSECRRENEAESRARGAHKPCTQCSEPRLPGRSRCKEHESPLRKKHNDKQTVSRGSGNYRKFWYKKAYGLTELDFQEMLTSQNNKCAIEGCEVENTEDKRLVIDHDHVTGQIRGLLCSLHNTGLGCFKDNPTLLKKAAEYVEKYK